MCSRCVVALDEVELMAGAGMLVAVADDVEAAGGVVGEVADISGQWSAKTMAAV